MVLDKQGLISWLKENNYRKMTAEEIIYEIQEGTFDEPKDEFMICPNCGMVKDD